MLGLRPKPQAERQRSDDAEPYLQWTLNSVTLTDEDAEAIARLAGEELNIEPFYELARFRSTFTFPIPEADVPAEEQGRIQRTMRRIAAEVIVYHEPAFERLEQVHAMRTGDTMR